MQEEDPEEFQDAVEFDELNRENPLAKRGASWADRLFIYKNAQPLATANLKADSQREKKSKQLPLICDAGFCHV
jgi:multidrug resistance efflux pump